MAIENFDVVISTFNIECIQILTSPNNKIIIVEKMRVNVS